jgi:hypothetical protein
VTSSPRATLRIALVALVALGGFGGLRVASAEPSAAAKLFAQGRALLVAHKYAEACVAFESSEKLDPQLGTMFNIAECDVEIGKLASAWQHYRELARTDPNLERRAASAQAAVDLEPRLPKLVLDLVNRPAGLTLTVDGNDVLLPAGEPLPVDVGDHIIAANAPNFTERTAKVTVQEREVAHVTLELEPVAPTEAVPVVAPKPPVVSTATSATIQPAADVQSRPRYRTPAKIALIAGGGVAAIGLALGGFAIIDFHAAETCTGCNRASQSHTAAVAGDISTALVIAGAISAALGGVYLWHTSASSATLVPVATPEAAGATIVGTF